MTELTIPIKRLDENAKLPTKAHFADAGFDLYALEDFHLSSGEVKKIRTGIAINIPQGYFGLIQDKSSKGSQGIKVFGGVIDSGYTGEILVCLGFLGSDIDIQNKFYSLISQNIAFAQHEKIAQLLIIENNPFISFEQVNDFGYTERGEKGFGSSGK